MKKFSHLFRLAAMTLQAILLAHTPNALAQSNDAPPAYPFAQSRPVPGRYIVVLKSSVANPAAEAANLTQGRGQLLHTYTSALKGFAANLPDAAVQAIRNNPNVEFVEQDQTVALAQVASPQNQATWGLDRIDQADRPLDTQYYFNQTGAGVNVFIVDTGMRSGHYEFTGRTKPGFNVIPDTLGTYDCHGHGTHVAGTAAGTTWGVAKNAFLIPVRVLDCNGYGTWSNVIAGVDWVANSPLRPAVANMSIGGTPSSALDGAIAGAVAKGVTVVVAAGNSNVDACTASPSREPSAITVGATSSSDARASFSNWGTCVDIFAPGVGITSAYNTSNSATYLMSGTSMATPHVSGAAALILESNPTASPAAVTLQIKSGATPNRITTVGTGSPNLLLNSLGTGGGYVAPPPTVVTQSVAVKSMTGSSNRTGGNWKASGAVTVRDVSTGAAVPNATVSGSFSPGGNSSCVTGSTGSCTLTSGAIKSNAASSTTLTATGISGTQLVYDASQNAVTQIVISKP